MASIISDPRILLLAFIGGSIPALLWLWFWLKEEENPEPKGLMAIVFIMGMIAVVATIPVEKFIQDNTSAGSIQVILWASTEEIMKFLAVLLIIGKSKRISKPIDWPIFMITAALGFATLENTFFLLKPLSAGGNIMSILAATSLGQLRFLGANLLHAVSSATIGISIGLSFYMDELKQRWFLLAGFLAAISLHSIFNFFIMKDSSIDVLQSFSLLWVITIIVMLIFEKVRRMSEVSEKIIN